MTRKIFVSVILVCMLASISWGAVSTLSEQIESVNKSLSEKIDGVSKTLTEKIDGVDKKLSIRMDDLRNGIYLVLTLIALVVSLPFIRKWYDDYAKQRADARKPAFTLEDVQILMERLIAENNVMLLNKIQGGMN